MVKARVDFIGNYDTRRMVAEYASQLSKAQGEEAQALRYGYVLGLTQMAKYDEALIEVKKLRQADPNNTFYRLAEAEALMKNQQTASALKLLSNTYSLTPRSQAANLAYADALLNNGNYKQARDILRRFIRNNPEHIQALSMLAEAQGKNNNVIEAYQTRADMLVLYGDYRGAIKQLEYALRDSNGNDILPYRLKRVLKS